MGAAPSIPEQGRGRAVDRRTDVWAFGCVLYEMLTAKPAFDGETITDILGAIVHKEPDWTLLPAETTPRLHELLRRCLQKDVKLRLRDMGDVQLDIDAIRNAPSQLAPLDTDNVPPSRRCHDGGSCCRGRRCQWRLPSSRPSQAQRGGVSHPNDRRSRD